ncbi:hypothetical protein ABK040_003672 [Willaertia magna]
MRTTRSEASLNHHHSSRLTISGSVASFQGSENSATTRSPTTTTTTTTTNNGSNINNNHTTASCSDPNCNGSCVEKVNEIQLGNLNNNIISVELWDTNNNHDNNNNNKANSNKSSKQRNLTINPTAMVIPNYHPHHFHRDFHEEEHHLKPHNDTEHLNSLEHQDHHHEDEHHDIENQNVKKGPIQRLKDRYLGFEQHLLNRSTFKRDNQFRSQLELITAIDEHCDHVLHTYSSFRLFILSIMGGVYVAIGTLFATLISSDLSSKSMQKFMVGIGFVGGFTMIIFSKSILFTEVNISVFVHMFKNDLIGVVRRSIMKYLGSIFSSCRDHHLRIHRPHKSIKVMTLLNSLKLWIISIIGNITGTLLMATILAAALVFWDNASVIQAFANLTKHKTHNFSQFGVAGWFSCVLSGCMANFMIGTATLLASSATTIIGKILSLAFPIIAFACMGVQHSPANVGYFSHTFIWAGMYGNSTQIPITPEIEYVLHEIGPVDSIVWNLIPAAIGNAIGGFCLAFLFVFIFIK